MNNPETEFAIPSAIIFLEFTESGPTLIQQSPLGYLKKDQIFQIQNFVFPSMSLFSRNLTLLYQNRKIIGHPKCVEGEKYHRNHYRFNFLLCFDGNLDIQSYQPILNKIANEFFIYETEEEFLSSFYQPERFQNILDKILYGLRNVGSVSLEITANNWLFLKVIPTNTQVNMEPIDSKLVPVINHDIRTLSHTELDLTIAEVLSHIDEIKPLSSLAKESDVTLKEIGTEVSQHLEYFKIIKGFVPLFQYANAYLISPKISLLLNDTNFQLKMVSYLKKDCDLELINMSEIIRLFLSLKHAQSLYHIYRLELNDIPLLGHTSLVRRVIEFGIFNKIIIPLKEYLFLSPPIIRKLKAVSSTIGDKFSAVMKRNEHFIQIDSLLWSDGGKHRDSIMQNLDESDCTTLFI